MSPVQSSSGQPHDNGHNDSPDFGDRVLCGYGSPACPNGGGTGTSRYEHDLSSSPDRAATEDRAAHALLDSFAQGNARAFWELWGLYQGHLYQICLSHMVGVREDAEDALSRSMLRALDKLPQIGPQIENIRAWLSRLTVNLCADMHRERKRRAKRLEQMDDALPNPGVSRPADADSPEDVFLNREACVCMCHAVNDLPNRLREPFALRFFQEMAYVDIAERLMLSNENVRKRIQQARDILKQRLHVTAANDRVSSWPVHGLPSASAGSPSPRRQEPSRRVLPHP